MRKPAPTLDDELKWMGEHDKWVRAIGKPPPQHGNAPAARFRDCIHCPERAQSRTERLRRSLCESCPYFDLPDGPSARAYFAVELATLPIELLVREPDALTYHEWQDAEKARNHMRGGF